jgi:2,3-dihydro-2,3-dihydroxybenzoate dehydrogenase
VAFGLAIARRLAGEGARLALIARSADGLDAAARAVREAGSSAEVFPADVADAPALEAAVASRPRGSAVSTS